MTRAAYIWVFALVGFVIWLHVHDESARRADVSRATRDALIVGARNGCKTNNQLRDQVDAVAKRLHPEYKVKLKPQNCNKTVERVVERLSERR